MNKLLKWAIAIVTVAAAARAVREVYIGRGVPYIPPGHHMHPGGGLMLDSAMPPPPCCSGCASGHGCDG
jgi:hypothetical protein